MLKIRYLKQLFQNKGVLIRILLSIAAVIPPFTGAYAQPVSCNLNALRLNGGTGWKYLAEITAECGSVNPNNMGGHLLVLHLPANTETRGVARQIKQDELDRFSIILVTGRTDRRTGEFVADSIIIEVSNLNNSMNQISDPINRFGKGFFVVRMDLAGNLKNGFRYQNGRTVQLGSWDAETVMDYLFEYWQNYFDSTDFVRSGEGLDR